MVSYGMLMGRYSRVIQILALWFVACRKLYGPQSYSVNTHQSDPVFQSVLASYASVAGDRKVSCLAGAYVMHLRTYFSHRTPDRVIHDCFGCVRARVLKSPADYEKFIDLYMYPDPSFYDRQLFTNPYKPERERPFDFLLSRSLSTGDEYVRKRELWAMKKEDQRCACRHCIGRFVRNEPIDCCGCLV